MKVVVTGASGFVGTALTAHLRGMGCEVVAVSRRDAPGIDVVADLRDPSDWRKISEGSTAFVHLAAIAHVHPPVQPSEATFRAINSEPLRAICAALRGSRTRLVFMSSVAAVCSSSREIVDDRTPARPSTPYGRSKLQAESVIRRELGNDSADWVVLRPPLVYGPGQKGSMRSIDSLVQAGMPVPTGPSAVRRSFLYVGNLVNAVHRAILEPAASRGTFLVSDGEAISIPELVARIARAHGRRSVTVPIPGPLLVAVAAVSGALRDLGVRKVQRAHEVARRLLEPLEINDQCFRDQVGWRPPFDGPTAFQRAFAPSMHH